MSPLHTLGCSTTLLFLHDVSSLPRESSFGILFLKDEQSGGILFTALSSNCAWSEREWRLEKTCLHLPFIPFPFSPFFSSPKIWHSLLPTQKQSSWSKIAVCKGWSESTLLYQLHFLLGVLLTFQKTVILMKTTQALKIKLTPFIKMQGGGEERERKRGRRRERKREKGRIALSYCTGAYRNHFVYQATFCLISKNAAVIAKQKSYRYFSLDIFFISRKQSKIIQTAFGAWSNSWFFHLSLCIPFVMCSNSLRQANGLICSQPSL